MNMKANSSLSLILICSLLHAQTASACINTTYSREEEKQLTGDLLKLITGQFAQHGPAFYTNEVTTLTAKLMESPDDVEARNDLAAAYLKLGEYETALTLFDEIEKSHPGRYRTQANLGVLRKKMEDFDLAAKHIENSLKIKPEGHLGLGDYYLKMIRWMEEEKSPGGNRPAKNFLGVNYSAGPKATVASKDFNREHIVTLIKADRHFADAMLVLGDALFVEENYELAMRAYIRAMDDLRHPAHSVLWKRVDLVHTIWSVEADRKEGFVVRRINNIQGQSRKEFAAAAAWLTSFQEVESERISVGAQVDFKTVKEAMKSRGLAEPIYLTTGVFKGTASRDSTFAIIVVSVTAFLAVVALLICIWIVRRVWRHLRRETAVGIRN
jgi:tetratricopeptide (TPR) repeat protein